MSVLQDLLDSGFGQLPSGVFDLTEPLHIHVEGSRFSGPGMYGGRCVLRPAAGVDALIVEAAWGKFDEFEIDGSNGGRHGVILRGAARSLLHRINVHNLTGDGFRVETGNNNLITFDHTVSRWNERGYAMPVWDPDGNGQPDNNGMEFRTVEATANRSSGMLLKGQKHIVDGGILESNGGYAVEIGEDTDIGFSCGTEIRTPWMEANALGTVRMSKKAVRNIYFRQDDNTRMTEGFPYGNQEVIWSNDQLVNTKQFRSLNGPHA